MIQNIEGNFSFSYYIGPNEFYGIFTNKISPFIRSIQIMDRHLESNIINPNLIAHGVKYIYSQNFAVFLEFIHKIFAQARS